MARTALKALPQPRLPPTQQPSYVRRLAVWIPIITAADFTAGTPSPRNSASELHVCSGPSNPSGVGAATPNTVFAGDATLLTVAVTPGANPTSTGLTVSCDLSAIGGPASQAFFDDGTNGDVSGGDNTFTFSTTVANSTTAGAKSLACTVSDAQARSGSASIGLTVSVIVPIGTVNGVVTDTEDATLHRSPYLPHQAATAPARP